MPHLKRVRKNLMVLGLALMLGACSALQFSYNNADSVLRYMAWDYFDLDNEQAETLHQHFVRLREWHRANELPIYTGLLQTAGQRISRGVTRTDVEWATGTLRSHYRALAQRAAHDATPILATLRAEQIAALEKKFSKENAKFSEQWILGEERVRIRKRTERMIDSIEDWTGELTAAQRARVGRFISAHPRNSALRLQERHRVQREVVTLLRRHKNPAELAVPLGRLFSEPESGRPEEYLRETRRWESEMAELIVDISAGLSTEQRSRVLRRMDRYAEDLRALFASGRRVVGDGVNRAPGS